MSTQTEDLEARATQFMKDLAGFGDHVEMHSMMLTPKHLAAFARSLAHPPAREVVEAGNAMAGLISRKTGMSTMQPTRDEWEHSLQAWDQALSALRGE